MLLRQKGDRADARTSKTTTSPSSDEFHNEDELILTGKLAHRVQSIIILIKGLIITITGYFSIPDQLWLPMLVPAIIMCVCHLVAFQLLGTSRRFSSLWSSVLLVSPFVLTPMCIAMPSEDFIAAHDEAQDGAKTMAILFFVGVSFSVNQRSLRWKLLNGAAFVGLSLAGELLIEHVHAYMSFTHFYVLYAHVPFVVGALFGHLIAYTLVEEFSPLHGQLREAERRHRELERVASAAAVAALAPLLPPPTFGDNDATSHASSSDCPASASASSVPKDRVSGDAARGDKAKSASAAAAASEEPTLTNVTVETHEDDGLVGEGAFATVHVGRWLGSKVAIKVPRKDGPSLELEAKTLTQLRHPCVCPFIGTVLHRGRLAIVMEYLEGGSLDALLQLDKAAHERRPIALSTRIRIAREAASGLAFLHARRYVHRDVKPENILLTGDYHAKIADFGIASGHENSYSIGGSKRVCMRSESTASVWTNTARVGTARYMAPEVMMIDEKVEGALQVEPESPGAAQHDGDHTSQSPWTFKVRPNGKSPAFVHAGTNDIVRQNDHKSPAKMIAQYGTKCDVYSFGLVSARRSAPSLPPLPILPSMPPKSLLLLLLLLLPRSCFLHLLDPLRSHQQRTRVPRFMPLPSSRLSTRSCTSSGSWRISRQPNSCTALSFKDSGLRCRRRPFADQATRRARGRALAATSTSTWTRRMR